MKISRFLFLAVALGVILYTSSCTKKYICRCDVKYTGVPGLPDSSSKEFDITDTKSNAKSKCEAESKTFDNGGIKTVETCYLY